MHNYLSPAEADVLAERARQIRDEGWTHERDDEYKGGQLSLAAMCYCMAASVGVKHEPTAEQYQASPMIDVWPWDKKWWKPKAPRRDLVRAAALIIAEIERIDRMTPGKL